MLKSMKASNLSYSQFGLFSLAGYPYSLKLLWSPLVDSIYSRRLGRRKSWVLPVQIGVGAVFYALGRRIDSWIVPGKPIDFWRLNGCFLLLVSLCATLDIAVDGWALTLLPSEKLHWASTCQSVGVNVGLFISFTIFLALSSERFCSEFLGMSRQMFTLGEFMRFWSFIYLGTTCLLLAVKERLPESLIRKHAGKSAWQKISSGYKTLIEIIKLPTVSAFAMILLSFKFGFSAYDAVAPLKLLEKGFPKEYLALTVLIDFPFQMVMGFMAAKWAAGRSTFRPWIIATYLRVLMSFVGLYVISRFPANNLTTGYATVIIITTVLTSFCHTTMFVSLAAYFVKISDAKYGGTYLTLLNTLSNFAGAWPKLPVMSTVDWMTSKQCSLGKAMSCSACKAAGGICEIKRDGFYPVASACLIVGLIAFQWWIKPAVKRLEKIPKHKWTVHSQSISEIIN